MGAWHWHESFAWNTQLSNSASIQILAHTHPELPSPVYHNAGNRLIPSTIYMAHKMLISGDLPRPFPGAHDVAVVAAVASDRIEFWKAAP